MPTTVPVRLGNRSYEIVISEHLLDQLGEHCKTQRLAGRCAVISDSNVAPLYAERALQSLAVSGFDAISLVVPAGEKSKSFSLTADLCDRMIAAGLDRSAFVVALGGGVVGDLAGFVAAIYYRGIPFIQVPTTILAQVDSSVGGKTGVNAAGGKNLIGAFHQPRLVLADLATLRSLPPREFNEGFAEIIKHGIIRDPEMLEELAHFDAQNSAKLEALIARNVAIKAAIVANDEHETTGERALLNFGHTIGHAIENAAGYGQFLHGEAISLGIIAACDLSQKKAGLANCEVEIVLARLAQFQLPAKLSHDIATEAILDAMMRDKKFARGEIHFVLTAKLGSAFISSDITLDDIRAAIESLR